MRIVNMTTEVKNIKIILADGTHSSVSLQPRGGRAASLPEGSQIDPSMIEVYRKFLRTDPALATANVQEDAPADGDE